MNARILVGDCRETLKSLPDGSVQCCVTSPPYYGLRDYGHDGQLGLEPTPDEYVANLVGVFREVRRVLRDDGTVFLNLGDSYAAGKTGRDDGHRRNSWGVFADGEAKPEHMAGTGKNRPAPPGLKPKDLIGIPWRVAFALQADGWWLRSDIVWSKPNPMPESVTDRPTKSHEYVFLLSKSQTYYYDADAIAEPGVIPAGTYAAVKGKATRARTMGLREPSGNEREGVGWTYTGTRNARTVWTITTQPYKESHFAVFPEELARRCIVAGCPKGGTVLDPFGGSGTVGAVAFGNGRDAVLCELNPEYTDMARRRIGPMFVTVDP